MLVPVKLNDIWYSIIIVPPKPWSAELRMKLLLPLKLNDAPYFAAIAPPPEPEATQLLMKLLVPVKLNTLCLTRIAPRQNAAELLMKLLVPVKLNDVLSCATIAPPIQESDEMLMKFLMKLLIPAKFAELVDPQIAAAGCSQSALFELLIKWIPPGESDYSWSH